MTTTHSLISRLSPRTNPFPGLEEIPFKDAADALALLTKGSHPRLSLA
jgi:hypothetical protein